MLHARPVELALIASNVADGTRPAVANGTQVTPAQNSLAQGYTTIISSGSITDDIYWVELIFHDWHLSTITRDAIAQIGLGGVEWIPPLLMSQAGELIGGTGLAFPVRYGFPLFGKSGQTVACRVSVNSADLTPGRVIVNLYGRPSGPVQVGSFVRAFGVDAANSRGTLITPGTTAEGAYAQLGSALAEPLWFWEFGTGINEGVIGNGAMYADIAVGDASNKKPVILNGHVMMGNGESIGKAEEGRFGLAQAGDLVYARAQYSLALETDHSIAVYGVGG